MKTGSDFRDSCVDPVAASDAAGVRLKFVFGLANKSASGAKAASKATTTSCEATNTEPTATMAERERTDKKKEGHGEPRGVRLTARTDSEGENPKDGAGMEKAWQVTGGRCEAL